MNPDFAELMKAAARRSAARVVYYCRRKGKSWKFCNDAASQVYRDELNRYYDLHRKEFSEADGRDS